MPTPSVFISALQTPKSHVNWNTKSQQTGAFYLSECTSSGAQNDELSFDFAVESGTYTFVLFNRRNNNRGIYTVQIDGSTVGTIDGYNASASGTRSLIAGLALTTGTHTLRLLMATKNGSSSSYFGAISAIVFIRTGS